MYVHYISLICLCLSVRLYVLPLSVCLSLSLSLSLFLSLFISLSPYLPPSLPLPLTMLVGVPVSLSPPQSFVCLSVCLCASLSPPQSFVCLSECLSLFLHNDPLSVCLSLFLPHNPLSVCLSTYLSFSPTILCLSICQCVCLYFFLTLSSNFKPPIEKSLSTDRQTNHSTSQSVHCTLYRFYLRV
jgi:hypothetical protein